MAGRELLRLAGWGLPSPQLEIEKNVLHVVRIFLPSAGIGKMDEINQEFQYRYNGHTASVARKKMVGRLGPSSEQISKSVDSVWFHHQQRGSSSGGAELPG